MCLESEKCTKKPDLTVAYQGECQKQGKLIANLQLISVAILTIKWNYLKFDGVCKFARGCRFDVGVLFDPDLFLGRLFLGVLKLLEPILPKAETKSNQYSCTTVYILTKIQKPI